MGIMVEVDMLDIGGDLEFCFSTDSKTGDSCITFNPNSPLARTFHLSVPNPQGQQMDRLNLPPCYQDLGTARSVFSAAVNSELMTSDGLPAAAGGGAQCFCVYVPVKEWNGGPRRQAIWAYLCQ